MDQELFRYIAITERPRIGWPGGARVAFDLAPDVERHEAVWAATGNEIPDPWWVQTAVPSPVPAAEVAR